VFADLFRSFAYHATENYLKGGDKIENPFNQPTAQKQFSHQERILGDEQSNEL
jgi:hypothetical protein